MRLFILLLVSATKLLCQAPNDELNTLLMHSTFRIIGPDVKKVGNISFGTVFFMGRPIKDDPNNATGVLVTAAHVLDGIAGDTATLLMRRRDASGTYTTFDYPFSIRDHGTPTYIKHATADVAVMYVRIPTNLRVLPMQFLADDKRIEELEIHPGDEVLCLGFPLLAGGTGGFPILRGGRLASYPLTPVSAVKVWNFDVLLYGGNSGGHRPEN